MIVFAEDWMQRRTITMSGIQQYAEQIVNANRIVMIACGTSRYAGLVAEYILKNSAASMWKWNMHQNSVTAILLSIKVM